MLKNLSFRQKIFFSQFVVFFLFLLLLFPFGQQTVSQIVRHSLEESGADLINQLKKQPSEAAMVEYLKGQELFVFFRLSLINDDCLLIYDSQLFHQPQGETSPLYPSAHPEVVEAFKSGAGYTVGWSDIFQRKFANVAVRFYFHGKPYVLRTAVPFAQVEILMRNFQIGIFSIDIIFLLFFSVATWFIFSRLSRPIHDIIDAVRAYQGDKEESLPQIHLQGAVDDDFTRLAQTLNSLSEKVRSHIRTLIEEKNEKEAILESLVEGVIAVDADGFIRYVNFTGSKMLGVPKRHLIGHPFPDATPAVPGKVDLLKRCHLMLKAAQDNNTVVTDSISIGEGAKVYLDLIAAPKPFRSGAIIVIQDKSNHYKVLEVGKDFVANASHELRTPITIIKGFAETLQDLPEISRDMLADIIEKIVRNCQRMDTLVKNLLTLADIENIPETRFQECDIVPMLENCRHMLLTVYQQAQVEIRKQQERVGVPADPDLLELAFMNLMDNAAKYSKPPAKITITLEAVGEEIKISVADQGIGIPKEDIDHVFERFYTVDKAHSRRLGGAGLGLSIVKTIIEKHEGTISVTSQVGKGTTFVILLPHHRHWHRSAFSK
jgi:two-component system phosphate regulon sensor histidine kinase PhoR